MFLSGTVNIPWDHSYMQYSFYFILYIYISFTNNDFKSNFCKCGYCLSPTHDYWCHGTYISLLSFIHYSTFRYYFVIRFFHSHNTMDLIIQELMGRFLLPVDFCYQYILVTSRFLFPTDYKCLSYHFPIWCFHNLDCCHVPGFVPALWKSRHAINRRLSVGLPQLFGPDIRRAARLSGLLTHPVMSLICQPTNGSQIFSTISLPLIFSQ